MDGLCVAQIPRIPWTPAEDAELKRAVAVHGDKRWSQISTYLPGRTSKACSHRWRTYLQPGVMHASSVPFSDWEKEVVKEAHKAVGNNWAVIARMLPGRTNAAVKNFWYQYKRRSGKAQGKRHGSGAGAADGYPDDFSDSEDYEEELGSADEMECDEEGYDEEGCDDDMAAADYSLQHTHTMEGHDCSATWQVAGAGMHSGGGATADGAAGVAGGAAAAAAGAAAMGWMMQEAGFAQQTAAAAVAEPFPATADVAHLFHTPGNSPWPFEVGPAAAAEMHGSCGGTGFSGQHTQDPALLQQQQQHPHQQQQHMAQVVQQMVQSQHQQHQQDLLRSCAPRRSSHHSWSGAPRSLPAAAGALAADLFSCPDGFTGVTGLAGPAAWDLQLGGMAAGVAQGAGAAGATAGQAEDAPVAAAAAAAEAAAVAHAEGAALTAAAAGVPFRRCSQPRISNHGHVLEPQQLAARASSRFLGSQLFERPADLPLPFQELHSRQVTTSNTGAVPAGSDAVHAAGEQPGQAAHNKPIRFALDLSAIDESEPESESARAPASTPAAAAAGGQHVSSNGGVPPGLEVAGGSQCMVSSRAGGSSGQSTGGQQGWGLELHRVHSMLDAAMQHMHVQQPSCEPPHLMQQDKHPRLHAEQQGAGQDGPPRKLVRPSLCSDAGSAPQQQAGATATLPPAAAIAEGMAGRLQVQQQYAAQQPLASSGTGGTLCGTKRRFVLDLSDPS